ncbi:hypothetical protein [Deinococcus maricopensis]|uniref:Putative drug resistance efflux protein n=1 Tax=Deinococcus maricopensis (strain DSM 21211 / LMG 22137 / NRRL B-23946 / LB-34) TaxID=709986 RepID=E8UB86_DEIML|nr:hypothetical protein [Deinococcus maricopensis]ADV68325.1 putative drug resistance efflux protein [Deinococcus maricopensis DSM 21211]
MKNVWPALIVGAYLALVILTLLLPPPWGYAGGMVLMGVLAAWVFRMERATGRSAGPLKWFALALGVGAGVLLVRFLLNP